MCTECSVKEDVLHAFLFCERVKTFWEWLESIIKKLKTDYATFNIDSAVLIYGFYVENRNINV